MDRRSTGVPGIPTGDRKIIRPYSPEAVALWMSDKGRSAYEAYADHADWTTYDGRSMPGWENLTDTVRGHWEHTALHVHAMVVKADDVSRETSSEGDV